MRRPVAFLASSVSIACVCCSLLVDTGGLEGTPPGAVAADGQADAPIDAEAPVDVKEAGTDARTLPAGAVVWAQNGHAYEVVLQADVSWPAARDAAKSRGGHLATITSSGENTFVLDLIVATPGSWVNPYGPWIGGYQPAGSAEPAGGWRWVTDEPFDFASWRTGEPSESSDENCIHYYANGARGDTWNDLHEDVAGVGAFVVEYE